MAQRGLPGPVGVESFSSLKTYRKHLRKKTKMLQDAIDTDWLGPEQSQSLKRQLSEMKSKITKVAEELDSLKQEMTEPQKQRINGLLNLIDKVVPILPRSQERVPSPPPSLPDIRIKEETHL